jgi:sigma-B regulation protein RsbU (phosphoserine phosphatase)
VGFCSRQTGNTVQVKWYHSISFNLFVLISVSILLTVAGVALQNSKTFEDFLSRQIEESTVSRARDAGKDIERQLDHWRSLGLLATQTLATQILAPQPDVTEGFDPAPFPEENPFLAQILASSREIIGLQLLRGTPPANMASKVARAIAESQEGFAEDLERATEGWLGNLPEERLRRKLNTGLITLPNGAKVYAVVLRLKISSQPDPFYTAVHVPLEHLRSALPGDQTQMMWLIDDASTSLVTTNLENESDSPVSARGLASLNQGAVPYGFKLFKGRDGRTMLGAFSEIPNYGLSVYVAQDAAGASIAIMRNVARSALWAWVFFLGAVLASYVVSDRLTSNLRALTDATHRIASGNFSSPIRIKGKDEVANLGASVNNMAEQIVTLLESKVAAARQEKELETARLVQESLFPRERLDSGHCVVTAKSVPASECGGDWWGHVKVDENRAYVFIADATGHGAAAALVTAMAFSTCKTLATTRIEKNQSPIPPNEILEILNRTLFDSGLGRNSMTFFAALLDFSNGTMTFANAGHNLPFVIPADEKDSRLGAAGSDPSRKMNHFKIRAVGNPLGMVPDSKYQCSSMSMHAGDKIFFYTDGLFESRNPSGEPWKEKSLRQSIAAHAGLDADRFQDGVFTDAFNHFSGKSIDDDITVVTVQIAKNWIAGVTDGTLPGPTLPSGSAA